MKLKRWVCTNGKNKKKILLFLFQLETRSGLKTHAMPYTVN